MSRLSSAFSSALRSDAGEKSSGFGASSRWRSSAPDSTLEVARWDKIRHASVRWAWWGGILGMLLGVVVFAPATWFAHWVKSATGDRLILAQAQGTVWRGDAVAVLTGGPGSRDARALPGRLGWRWHWQGTKLTLALSQSCCMSTPLQLAVKPGWRRVRVDLGSSAPAGAAARWPAAWLSGLGAPWNTLDLTGFLQLNTSGMQMDWTQGQMRIQGSAQLVFQDVASRVTPLERLGTYELSIRGTGQSQATFDLTTRDGALLLRGAGQAGPGVFRFTGEATASEADREALNNLLNIIGRRSGDRAYLSIG